MISNYDSYSAFIEKKSLFLIAAFGFVLLSMSIFAYIAVSQKKRGWMKFYWVFSLLVLLVQVGVCLFVLYLIKSFVCRSYVKCCRDPNLSKMQVNNTNTGIA